MVTKKDISNQIFNFSDGELNQLEEYIRFIKYQRIININHTKESLLQLLSSNGISSFEELAKMIKTEIPFIRSGYDFILASDLIKWLTVTLAIEEVHARHIIDILINLGMLRNSGLGNYK